MKGSELAVSQIEKRRNILYSKWFENNTHILDLSNITSNK